MDTTGFKQHPHTEKYHFAVVLCGHEMWLLAKVEEVSKRGLEETA